MARQNNRNIDYVGYYADGLFNARKEGKWGFIDAEGFIIFDFQWDNALSFSDGYAWVQKDGLYGCIDTTGNIVIPLQYTHCQAFENGYAYAEKSGTWYRIDKKNTIVGNVNGFPPDSEDPLRDSLTLKYWDKWQVDKSVDGYIGVMDKTERKNGAVLMKTRR